MFFLLLRTYSYRDKIQNFQFSLSIEFDISYVRGPQNGRQNNKCHVTETPVHSASNSVFYKLQLSKLFNFTNVYGKNYQEFS